MRWAWTVGKLGEANLRIHVTFLLLLAWVAIRSAMEGHSAGSILSMVSFVLALFAAVLLHELGHLLAANKFGLPFKDVTLLPIGGVSRPGRSFESVEHEIQIALAGPAANAVIAVFLSIWLFVMHAWEPISHIRLATGPFIERLFVANVALVFFNLIPASPMDGGRVLRALLATKMPYQVAVQYVSTLGQGLALLLGFIGLFTGPTLLFFAMFVWIGAHEEYYAAQMTSALASTPAAAVMVPIAGRVNMTDTLADAVRLTLGGVDHDLPVVDGFRVVGILTRTELLAALAQFGQDYSVSLVMRREFVIAAPDETLNKLFHRVHSCDCHTTYVVQEGRLVGLITMEHLGEYLLFESHSHGEWKISGTKGQAHQTVANPINTFQKGLSEI